jgi:K+-sensing histidine kinase KdpD
VGRASVIEMRAEIRWLRSWPVGALAGFTAVAAVTGVIEGVQHFVPVLSLGVLYVFSVLPIAVVWGTAYGVAVALASMLAFRSRGRAGWWR